MSHYPNKYLIYSLLLHLVIFIPVLISWESDDIIDQQPPIEVTILEPELKSLPQHNNKQDPEANILSEKNNKSSKPKVDITKGLKSYNQDPAKSDDNLEKYQQIDSNEESANDFSTREFKYFSFFKRVKEGLKQSWIPAATNIIQKDYEKYKAKKIYKKYKNKYITRIIAKIDHRGYLIEVIVEHSSGNQDIDNIALNAFKETFPLPNIPTELLEDGVLTLKWQFILWLLVE